MRFRGHVIQGKGIGTSIGFPTANIAIFDGVLPQDGVYAVKVHVEERVFFAAMHCGPRHTFCENDSVCEMYLLDFDGDLYGKELDVEVVKKIRNIRRFENTNELKKQIEQDVVAVRRAQKVPRKRPAPRMV